MKRNDKTKLELIRLEGIRNLILFKISKIKLENICRQSLKIESKNYQESLKKLSRNQLIKIIEISEDISSEDINNTYEQFRYGLKPGFTIFNFVKNESTLFEVKSAKSEISKHLSSLIYIDDAKFKKIRLKDVIKIQQLNTYEFCFDYLSKYTYISEEDEPVYIYELKDCFVWLNLDKNFVAIKNCPNDILNKLINCFSELLNTKLYNIKISRNLIGKIFNGKIKKGTFVKPNAGEDEAKKIIIADDELEKKKIFVEDVNSYDMSNTFLDEKLDENTKSTLGINCKLGKIYLTKNVNASQFRNWSIENINKITDYINNINNCKDYEIFKSRNILSNTTYSNETKDIIENICYDIFIHLNSGENNIQISYDSDKIFEKLKNKFYFQLFGYCQSCDEETQIFCNKCNSSKLNIIKNTLFCLECGEKVIGTLCDEGHNIYNNNINDLLRLIPTQEFLNEINEILYSNFKIRLDGTFSIGNNYLNIHKYANGEIIDVSTIREFENINKIQITNLEEVLSEYDKIKEKCKNSSNSMCSSCSGTSEKCIMNLFVGIGNYRPSPHQGHEFGDVNFMITDNSGNSYNFVGVAKSKPKNGILNLSDSSSREMIQQILTMSHDKRVNVVGAICPSKFHDQLRQELYYLAQITKMKMIILDDIFMCKLLLYKKQ